MNLALDISNDGLGKARFCNSITNKKTYEAHSGQTLLLRLKPYQTRRIIHRTFEVNFEHCSLNCSSLLARILGNPSQCAVATRPSMNHVIFFIHSNS